MMWITRCVRRFLILAACMLMHYGPFCASARSEFIIVDQVGANLGESFSFSTTFNEVPDFFTRDGASTAHSVAYDLTWDESVSPTAQGARGTDVVLRMRGESADELQIVVFDARNWGNNVEPAWIELGSVPATISDRTLSFEVSNELIRDESGSFFLHAFAMDYGKTTSTWYGYVGSVPEPATSTTVLIGAAGLCCCCRRRRYAV